MLNKQIRMKRKDLSKIYTPSDPCSCDICRSYCKRPGWWTVKEAEEAFELGYGNRMMLEISEQLKYGVLAPAFSGNEQNIAYNVFANAGCTFLKDGLCELHGTDIQPLECRYCHHSRRAKGQKCHLALGEEWLSAEGQRLVIRWMRKYEILEKHGIVLI